MSPHVALVIDNDHDVLEEVELLLGSLGHECHCASDQEEAEALLTEHSFCYVVLDLNLPVKGNRLARIQTGYNILTNLRQRYSQDELPVIVMTAHGKGHEHSVRAFKRGATDYIQKPFDGDSEPLEEKVREAMAKTCEARHAQCPNLRCVEPAGTPGNGATAARCGRIEERHSSATDHSFRFVGDCRRRRYRMTIDGEDVWVQLGTFSCLFRLAARLKQDPPGWVCGAEISESSFHSVLYRLRQDLEKLLDLDGSFVECDGHGRVRLSVPVENVTFDLPRLRADHSHLLKLLPEV